MSEPQPLGTAWAWLVDGQWHYTRERERSPADALEVTGFNADGELVLHHAAGGAGQFIRGAVRVGRGD